MFFYIERVDKQGAGIMPHSRLGVLMTATCLLLTTAVPAPAPAAPEASPAVPTPSRTAPVAGEPAQEWTVDLTLIDSDDTNLAYPTTGQDSTPGLRIANPTQSPASQRRPAASQGMLVAAPHLLARPADRVRAELVAWTPAGSTVDVDARAWRTDGWSQWQSAAGPGAVFDQMVTRVQVRVTLTVEHPAASPVVSEVRLSADTAPHGAGKPGTGAGIAALGLTYRVYATREGLVGGTTANGHVIVPRDHFVALPSRRGLAPRGTGDFSVRVCTTSGSRCEYAPVWDIGPWNTRDDYWNPSSVREMWQDLPQGTPEAQAAYLNGYNGGRDQFGRTVLNPAGIDLADGTFWDGLLLADNSWVIVSYLWTAGGAKGRVDVTTSSTLNVRSGPGTSFGVVAVAADFANVPIECWLTGQTVTGTFGTTNRWDRLASGHYVSHAYVAPVTGTPAAC